jgi:anaerobic magnesium-protoporphyrin IX monomethyl ester cyclase
MPQLPKDEIEGLLRTFPLYIKMPKRKFPLIKLAEQNTPEGNVAFKKLAKEYQEKYW